MTASAGDGQEASKEEEDADQEGVPEIGSKPEEPTSDGGALSSHLLLLSSYSGQLQPCFPLLLTYESLQLFMRLAAPLQLLSPFSMPSNPMTAAKSYLSVSAKSNCLHVVYVSCPYRTCMSALSSMLMPFPGIPILPSVISSQPSSSFPCFLPLHTLHALEPLEC